MRRGPPRGRRQGDGDYNDRLASSGPLPRDEVAEEVQMAADRPVGAVWAGGPGVAGLDGTRAALEHRQVDEPLLDPSHGID